MLQFETKIIRTAKVLMVEWEDSVGGSDWEGFNSNSTQSMDIVSVGYSIEVTDTFIVLVPHIHKGANGLPYGTRGALQIPKRAIKSVRELVLKEAPVNAETT